MPPHRRRQRHHFNSSRFGFFSFGFLCLADGQRQDVHDGRHAVQPGCEHPRAARALRDRTAALGRERHNTQVRVVDKQWNPVPSLRARERAKCALNKLAFETRFSNFPAACFLKRLTYAVVSRVKVLSSSQAVPAQWREPAARGFHCSFLSWSCNPPIPPRAAPQGKGVRCSHHRMTSPHYDGPRQTWNPQHMN